jgi:hypothetical protein
MNARKLIRAAIAAFAALAIVALGVAAAAPATELLTWLAVALLIASAPLGIRIPRRAFRRLETNPPAIAKQRVPLLGSACYVGSQIQGIDEKHLTTICLA